jgi:hypothetical protein
MKNDPLSAILVGVLFLSAVLSLLFCGLHTKDSRDLRIMQNQIGSINQHNANLNALIREVMEYSKKNPAINPILTSFGVATASKPVAPAASATKPATK